LVSVLIYQLLSEMAELFDDEEPIFVSKQGSKNPLKGLVVKDKKMVKGAFRLMKKAVGLKRVSEEDDDPKSGKIVREGDNITVYAYSDSSCKDIYIEESEEVRLSMSLEEIKQYLDELRDEEIKEYGEIIYEIGWNKPEGFDTTFVPHLKKNCVDDNGVYFIVKGSCVELPEEANEALIDLLDEYDSSGDYDDMHVSVSYGVKDVKDKGECFVFTLFLGERKQPKCEAEDNTDILRLPCDKCYDSTTMDITDYIVIPDFVKKFVSEEEINEYIEYLKEEIKLLPTGFYGEIECGASYMFILAIVAIIALLI